MDAQRTAGQAVPLVSVPSQQKRRRQKIASQNRRRRSMPDQPAGVRRTFKVLLNTAVRQSKYRHHDRQSIQKVVLGGRQCQLAPAEPAAWKPSPQAPNAVISPPLRQRSQVRRRVRTHVGWHKHHGCRCVRTQLGSPHPRVVDSSVLGLRVSCHERPLSTTKISHEPC